MPREQARRWSRLNLSPAPTTPCHSQRRRCAIGALPPTCESLPEVYPPFFRTKTCALVCLTFLSCAFLG